MSSNLDGFWDPLAEAGPVTGSGPGHALAMRKFKARQAREKERGKWRKAPTFWKSDKGTYVDPDYYIVPYDINGW